nr:MAG TPA: hypothetical protein [Caudoviricetes sp.]
MKTKTQPTNAGYAVIYNQRKRTRKEYLRKNNLISKKPWYTLTKSELKAINKNKIVKPMGKAKFMESTVQHKLSKWVKKNPKPDDKQNLFYKEFLEDWKKKLDKALEYFRDFVVSIYDKAVLPFDSKKALIVPMIDTGYGTYAYPNMDPLIIGYPLCRFSGKRFVKKNIIADICKETLKKVSKQYNCKSVSYTYERKVLLSIAA